MLERGRGHIILLTSDAGRRVFPGQTVYSACKHFCEAFATGLRLELVGTGVRITCVEPGNVRSQGQHLAAQRDAEAVRKYGEASDEDRAGWIEPETVADAVYFALSQPANVALNQILLEPINEPIPA